MEVGTKVVGTTLNNNNEKMKELRPRRTLAEVLWDDLYILMHYFTPLLVIYNLSWYRIPTSLSYMVPILRDELMAHVKVLLS